MGAVLWLLLVFKAITNNVFSIDHINAWALWGLAILLGDSSPFSGWQHSWRQTRGGRVSGDSPPATLGSQLITLSCRASMCQHAWLLRLSHLS